MNDPFNTSVIEELFRVKENGYLYHRESIDLEFKEQFNHAGWPEYLRDFAAFANNSGGYVIFGIKNSPREPIGMNDKSIDMFVNTDEEFITGELNKLFLPSINWSKFMVERSKKKYGVFYVEANMLPPVIACADEGVIKNGEIYYRYGGRSQKIQYAELNNIILRRIEKINTDWMSLVNRIGKIGPSNAAILDTESGIIEKDQSNILVIDENLLPKIKFIRQGQFKEEGDTTLRLVGDVQPVSNVEVVKYKERNILEKYPYSCMDVVEEVKKILPKIGQNKIFRAISENSIKSNPDYATYNFRNKSQEEKYRKTGEVSASMPIIYSKDVVVLLAKILRGK